MELVIGLVIGALAAGAAVWFAAQKKAAEAQVKLAAADEARAEADKLKRKVEGLEEEAAKARREASSARDEAKLEAENARRKAELEIEAAKQKATLDAKEVALKARQEAETALEKKHQEIEKAESRIEVKEQALDRKTSQFDERDKDLRKREQQARELEKRVQDQETRYAELVTEAKAKLEKAAGLSSEQAKKEIIASIAEDAEREAAREVKRIEDEAAEEAGQRAKRIVGIAIQRYAGDYALERTVSTVQLANDEQKGRIIGREGRNIRALEAATGIDIIIDDTPEAIILSGYNPIRREVAKRAIDELLKDGRIHPARIEEVVAKHAREVEASTKEWGEKAMFELGLGGLHPDVVKLMGSLRYRTSYTQNQWEHSVEVGFIVGAMAAELKLPIKDARRAGFLHDLGKAVSHEVEGGHAVIGADLAKKYGEKDHIVHAIRAHHDDVKPETILAHLVAAGDAISGARPGARSENLDQYVKRMEELEKISLSFPGVEKAFAVQAGREMRVIVNNAKVDDAMAVMLSRDIARKVESELTYPGQIRVTVIRETRAVDIAR